MGFRQIQAPDVGELSRPPGRIGIILSGELELGLFRSVSCPYMYIQPLHGAHRARGSRAHGLCAHEARRDAHRGLCPPRQFRDAHGALAKYGGEMDHAIESSLVEARDVRSRAGRCSCLGERGTPGSYTAAAARHHGRAARCRGCGRGHLRCHARWMRRFDTTIAELSGPVPGCS